MRLRQRPNCPKDLLDLRAKMVHAQSALDQDIKDFATLDEEGQSMLSGERKVVASKKKGVDLVLGDDMAPLTEYIRSFDGVGVAGGSRPIEYGAMPCCDSYASLTLLTMVQKQVSDFDRVDSKTALGALIKSLKGRTKPFTDIIGACKAAHNEFQAALKTIKKRESQRAQKRTKEEERGVREAESERKRRMKNVDGDRSSLFASVLSKEAGAKPIKRLATMDDFQGVKDWNASRPMIFAKSMVWSLLGPFVESKAAADFLQAQVSSFEQGLKTSTASKYGGRMLSADQAAPCESVCIHPDGIHSSPQIRLRPNR